MKQTNDNVALLIHIEHSKPIEINEFTSTLNSIGHLYKNYVRHNGFGSEMGKSKLYVEKIEEGCIDIYLCELIASNLIPFMENANILFDFANHIKGVVEFYTKGKGDNPDLTIEDCNDFNNVFAITAGDNKGKTTIGAIDRSNKSQIYNGCTFNYFESNSAQNQIKTEKELLKEDNPEKRVFKRELMTVFQMRSKLDSDTGNKAVIESLSSKRMNVVFSNEELKSKVLFLDENPAKKAFFVDGEILSIGGKDVAYKITALHDIIDLED